jgi:hypothetical protein
MLGSAKLHIGGTGEGPGVGGDGGDTGGQEKVSTHWSPCATYAPVAYEPSGQTSATAGTGSPEQSTVPPELELELETPLDELAPELELAPGPPSPMSPVPGAGTMAPEHATETMAAARAAHEARSWVGDMPHPNSTARARMTSDK